MKKGLLAVFFGVLIYGVCSPLQAALIFQLNQTYDGTSPSGPPPWLEATFENDGLNTAGQNRVILTMSAIGLREGEHVKEWDFNIDPTGLGTLTIDYYGAGSTGITGEYDQNGVTAGSAQGFDIEFLFPNSNGSRFVNGSVVQFIFEATGLDESDFNVFNASDNGQFNSAAHVGSIGAADASGWIATGGSNTTPTPVPEPATMLLLGFGLMGLALIGRRLH